VIRDVANKKNFGELPSDNGLSNADNVVSAAATTAGCRHQGTGFPKRFVVICHVVRRADDAQRVPPTLAAGMRRGDA
jgi:hypothetical protein